MMYRGASNWPPLWVKKTPAGVKTLKGEVGVLKYVFMRQRPADKCYLVIECEHEAFVGRLSFDNEASCGRISTLLRTHVGRSIKEIGDLEV